MRPKGLTTSQIELMRELVEAGDLLLKGIAEGNAVSLTCGRYRMVNVLEGISVKNEVIR